jgi:hypothetical protein
LKNLNETMLKPQMKQYHFREPEGMQMRMSLYCLD